MLASNSTGLVGNTPLVKLEKLAPSGTTILGKMESLNPTYSVKDRIAMAMIEDAEKNGRISNDTVIVEPTSGNTGIGLAFVCAQRGYRLILTMPESMSGERRKLLRRLGAEIVLTKPEKGMSGAVDQAQSIVDTRENAIMLQQFRNPANPGMHYRTTGPEIWSDTGGNVDVLVAGVGTGGTITGAGRYLREQNPDITIVAVEPRDSAVLSGGSPGPHRIQGIGAGFVPEVLDRNLLSEVVTVGNDEAFETSLRLAREEGILAGISAGANVWAAVSVAGRSEMKEKVIVTIICDTGERYLSLWE